MFSDDFQRTFALRARLVFPVDGEPIRDGIVAIDGERIVSVGTAQPNIPVYDLGNAAILPGLANAHAHLEFSDLSAPLGHPGMAFPDWIRRVIEYRKEHWQDASGTHPIETGLRESLACGTTTLGEIASPGWPPAAFTDAPLDGVVFLELLGLRPERIEPKLAVAREHLGRPWPNTGWRPGLSPHAPYSVHPELFQQAVQLAAGRDVPIAFHLAESPEELELLRTGGGPFRPLLEELAAWDADAIPLGMRPLDYLRVLAASGCRALIIHGNYLDDEEIALIAQHPHRLAVIYCPRTHDYFRHEPHPLPRLLAAGATVALGTDSRASNPDLSVLEEMRFVARQAPSLPGSTILRLGTLHGAQALGCGDTTGSLRPGKYANLAVVGLPNRDEADPHSLLLNSTTPVLATYHRGERQS